jgi:response regulator RpfG family c-di-GMP phosphodiesterase
MQMLVVEDGHETLDALRRLFEVDGYRIDGVTVFSEALQLLHAVRYDLVAVDLDHPAGDAAELVRSRTTSGDLCANWFATRASKEAGSTSMRHSISSRPVGTKTEISSTSTWVRSRTGDRGSLRHACPSN